MHRRHLKRAQFLPDLTYQLLFDELMGSFHFYNQMFAFGLKIVSYKHHGISSITDNEGSQMKQSSRILIIKGLFSHS